MLTAFLWLVARADVEPELSHHGYCEKIEDSPLPEDDHNFNFFQVTTVVRGESQVQEGALT